jgi:hypothetical protein
VNNRTHGIISLFLAIAAITLAGITIMDAGTEYLAAYSAACLVGSMLILTSFCAKCACRERCAHLLPGLAVRLLPKRRVGPYSAFDYLLTGIGGLLILLPPQFHLPTKPVLLIVFWLLLGIAFLQIRRRVCPACDNPNCPANPASPRPSSRSAV